MRHLVRFLFSRLGLAPLLVALVLAGCGAGSVSEGIAAYSIDGRDVSQRSVDLEFELLAENRELQKVVEQGGSTISNTPAGSIVSDLAAGWLSQVIALDFAGRERARQGLSVTADDRAKGQELGAQAVGGEKSFDEMAEWFQNRLTVRWSNVAALQRELLASGSEDVEAALAQQCPSRRYVSHILVATAAEAEQIAAELDGGADFAEIAAARSTDTGSAAQGGQLGCGDGQQFVEPFATVASTQPIGVVSDPVQTEFGFHLILVESDPPAAEIDRVTLDAILGGGRGKDVELDRRYGTWDRETGRVVPPGA